MAADTTGVDAERDDADVVDDIAQVLDGLLEVHVAHGGGDLAAVLVVHAQVGATGLDSCTRHDLYIRHTKKNTSQTTRERTKLRWLWKSSKERTQPVCRV